MRYVTQIVILIKQGRPGLIKNPSDGSVSKCSKQTLYVPPVHKRFNPGRSPSPLCGRRYGLITAF